LLFLPKPQSLVPVLANFPAGLDHLYVEKVFSSNRNLDDFYTPPDSLITRGNPKLHVANFSATAVTIQIGQVLRIGHNPILGWTELEDTPLRVNRKLMLMQQ